MADDAGFLSRWSRRKVQSRDGAPVAEARPPELATPSPALPVTAAAAGAAVPSGPAAAAAAPGAVAEPARPAAPTLADVSALTRESDYSRFVTPGVEPGVKNAALKKLFTDPHFNVMDGLDTYIDDYNRPDPLPASMLRQMVQAQALGLFNDETPPAEAPDADVPDAPGTSPPPSLAPTAHEDTDLRLQPHDAAGRPGPEPGPRQDGGREP